jgi:hypothetical protein
LYKSSVKLPEIALIKEYAFFFSSKLEGQLLMYYVIVTAHQMIHLLAVESTITDIAGTYIL